MNKIIPFLWFDNQAEEAANFYISLFKDSKVVDTSYYGEVGPGAEGSIMTVTLKLNDQEFIALNGGPYFTFTPAVSFFVNCDTNEEIDELWDKLSKDGMALMELTEYPFSKKFGWVQDKFGVSWQLNLASSRQKITPFLMFTGDNLGKAEEAMNLYISLFNSSKVEEIERYGSGEMGIEGSVKRATFTLDNQEFMAIDSNFEHPFTFTPAISFFVNCETQEEVDMLWEKLSEGGKEVKCGWLEDKYGVTWQIVPTVLGELLKDEDTVRAQRVTEAMLKMKKLSIEGLKKAYEQE